MKPTHHLALSVTVGGGVWAATGSPGAVATSAAAGVLADTDHLVDYYLWFVRGQRDRVFYLLHGWEYLIPLAALAAVSGSPLAVGALLGYLSHLVTDHIFNRASPLFYSLVFRTLRGFRLADVSEWGPVPPDSVVRALPLGRYWVPPILRAFGVSFSEDAGGD